MSVGSPTAGTWSSSQWRPDNEFETDRPVTRAIDVIVGGPPCQAFARVGRPKLREIDEHPRAFMHDPRTSLYLHYLEYVEAFQPLALLMENIPDVLNHGGQNIAEDICEVLERKGYVTGYTLLNAAFYGVPQMRERMFLVAYRRELDADVRFPSPTNWLELPTGYNGTRSVALRLMRHDLCSDDFHYIKSPASSRRLKHAVTVEQAIGDLPPITLHLEGKLRRGATRRDRGRTPGRPCGSRSSASRCIGDSRMTARSLSGRTTLASAARWLAAD